MDQYGINHWFDTHQAEGNALNRHAIFKKTLEDFF
jgi:hypothetical protein